MNEAAETRPTRKTLIQAQARRHYEHTCRLQEWIGELGEEIERLRERLENKTASLRVEIAAKQGAYNEIRIMEMALRRAVRALDEEQAIQPESQIHRELKDALPPPPASQGEGE